ncbi:MAG TPA: VOC family protein [Acidimicrobiales bacterium]|nr:VOC family protein [Acidimicrobiales bacterium]
MATSDPFEALHLPLVPRRPRPQFAAALKRRLTEELSMTTAETTVRMPAMFHIRVPDPDQAMAFFGAVFDWEGERVEFEGHIRHYMTNTTATQPVITDEPGAWDVRVGFTTDDLNDAMATIERNGGRIGERGDTWVMADDGQGVALVVWTPRDAYPHAPPTKVATGELTWFEILVPSAERAKTFYGDLLGWKYGQFEGGPYHHVLDATGGSAAGITEAPDALGVMIYATVPDIDAARARVVAAGGTVDASSPMGPGVGCHCTDDQGTRFGLWSAN